MNKKQLFLTSALLALSTSYAYAQTLQLNNGDSLEVELIQETDITLTYLHTILGKQTIQKSDIRNFSELNLIGVDKVREGAEGQAGLELYEAEKKQEAALIEVNDAKNQLEVDKKELTTATGVGVKIAEQKELASENRLVTAEKSLVTANAAVVAAKAKLQTTKNISVASEQVNLAKSELKQAKKDEKTAQKDLVTAEKELDNADSKSEAQAESKVETAKENLLLAEGAAKTAKGEKINNGFMGTGIFKDWDSSINFGLSGASDRTNNVTLNLGFNALYEDNSRRWIFKSSYYYDAEGADGSSGQDSVNDNQANITLIRDWFFSDSAWFAYASTIDDSNL